MVVRKLTPQAVSRGLGAAVRVARVDRHLALTPPPLRGQAVRVLHLRSPVRRYIMAAAVAARLLLRVITVRAVLAVAVMVLIPPTASLHKTVPQVKAVVAVGGITTKRVRVVRAL